MGRWVQDLGPCTCQGDVGIICHQPSVARSVRHPVPTTRDLSFSEGRTAVPVSRWEAGAQKGLTLSVQLYLHTSPLVQQVLIHPHWPFAHAVPSARNSLQLLLQDQESPTFSNKPSLIALAPMIILSFEIPGHLPSSVPSFNLTHVQHTCALGQALSWSQGDSAVDWAERSSLLPLCGRQASAHCDSAETQDSVGDSDAWRLRGESPQLSGG